MGGRTFIRATCTEGAEVLSVHPPAQHRGWERSAVPGDKNHGSVFLPGGGFARRECPLQRGSSHCWGAGVAS